MTKTEESESNGCFVKFSSEYERKNTIQHWQLRDLLSFGKDDRYIYTVNHNSIFKYDLHKRQTHNLKANCGHPPTTMALNDSFLAAGTDRGELQVYSLNEEGGAAKQIFSAVVTNHSEVLNHLHLKADDNGASRLYACGNDRTVRCYSAASMEQTDCLGHTVAVNSCAESPHGGMLATVGDHDIAQLFVRDSTGKFVLDSWLRSDARDAGMSCSWHPWGSCVAAAFQCGHAVVWDVRSGKKVADHQVKSAVRCIKFSSAPVDLLAFSEHESQFHIVDARKYQSRHSVTVPGDYAALSGLAFSPRGDRVYVGLENRGIQEFQVDGVARRGCSNAHYS